MESKADIRLHTLANGVRIISEKIPGVRSCSIGIWVGAGSRMEQQGEHGITHFIEHLLFKGTERRTAKDIAEALDSVGGQLNAFTAKEMTCYYARVMDVHLPMAVDVLTDMLFHSTFQQDYLDKERGVIKEEISMYEDSPDELIHDVFLTAAWPDNPLGTPILGTAESLDAIDGEMIRRYIQRQYVPERIVVACAGSLEHDLVLELLAPAFEGLEQAKQPPLVPAPAALSGEDVHMVKDTGQVQICLGTRGVAAADDKNYPMYVLNNVLGGGLSSRLVQTIREERGLAYSTYSFNSAFSDAGIYALCAGTSPKTAELVISLIRQEMESIRVKGVTPDELSRAKEQVRGGLYMGLESVSNRMNRLGRNLLMLDRIISPETTMEMVDAVVLEDIPKLAEYLFQEPHVLATIGPEGTESEEEA
ncbi:MAG: insulinase family protein [Clostridiales bacterium]|nr:insulinase family protein [Clostridiales bacterium]